MQDEEAWDRAATAFRASLEFLPDRVATLQELSHALHKTGDLAGSAVAAERAAQLAPQDPNVLYKAALAYHFLGRWDRALEYGRSALTVRPNAATQLMVALCLQKLQRIDEARSAYRKTIALDSQLLYAYTLLAATLPLEQAIAVLEDAVAAGIENAELYKHLGRNYFELGDAPRAAELQRQAIVLDPENIQAHSNLGGILATIGLLDQARAAYTRASVLDPHNAQHYYQLAELARALGDEPVADEQYHHALRLDPDHVGARINYGWLHYRRGNYAAAIRHFRHVLSRAPNSAAQFNLGLALLAQGRVDSARTVYAAAVEHYGMEEAERIGADEDLLSLAEAGAEAARAIYLRYWP